MQMFHMPVTSAMQGDRLGICVTQFDPKLLERGLVCAPESLHTVHAALISVEKIDPSPPSFAGEDKGRAVQVPTALWPQAAHLQMRERRRSQGGPCHPGWGHQLHQA